MGMAVTSIIVQHGQIIGATLDANGTIKRARLSDLKKLYDTKKITSGIKVINDSVYFDLEVLSNIFEQPEFEFDHYDYDSDGKATQAVLTDGTTLSFDQLWGLAADHRIKNVAAYYDKPTACKILQTAQ